MLKKSLTRLNFASSQLFCNLIKIVKADHLSQTHLNMYKSSASLFLCELILSMLFPTTHSLSPSPPPQKFKMNPLRLLYFIQQGFIGQFCDCLQI